MSPFALHAILSRLFCLSVFVCIQPRFSHHIISISTNQQGGLISRKVVLCIYTYTLQNYKTISLPFSEKIPC
ncbi:Uncharacterized protein HZ326_7561 [Fusarium oxysporum f. sp. albedinis]|nr:Uncharacterized protein HZ326_7561 [Fusarium oxysporum f. sp. albedinis]